MVATVLVGEGYKDYLQDPGQELVAPSCNGGAVTTAYLAQHEFFEQCPVLRADVPVPAEWHQVLGPPSRCNAWIGTNSTLTPCHWDSYDAWSKIE